MRQLEHLPVLIGEALKLDGQVRELAEDFADKQHALFLGRGTHWPVAMEGALKLKEISYIHAEAYAAGELKHGPLALVDKDMPVIAVAPNDALLDKLKSNMEEVRARGGELYLFADETVAHGMTGRHVVSMPADRHHRRAGGVDDSAAVAGVPHRRAARHRCGPAAQSGEIGDGGVSFEAHCRVGGDQLAHVLIDQRPERIAAQPGQRAKRNRDRPASRRVAARSRCWATRRGRCRA